MIPIDELKVGDTFTFSIEEEKFEMYVEEILLTHMLLTDGKNNFTLTMRWKPGISSEELTYDHVRPEYANTLKQMCSEGFTLKSALKHYNSLGEHETCAKIQQVIDAEKNGKLWKEIK